MVFIWQISEDSQLWLVTSDQKSRQPCLQAVDASLCLGQSDAPRGERVASAHQAAVPTNSI